MVSMAGEERRGKKAVKQPRVYSGKNKKKKKKLVPPFLKGRFPVLKTSKVKCLSLTSIQIPGRSLDRK